MDSVAIDERTSASIGIQANPVKCVSRSTQTDTSISIGETFAAQETVHQVEILCDEPAASSTPIKPQSQSFNHSYCASTSYTDSEIPNSEDEAFFGQGNYSESKFLVLEGNLNDLFKRCHFDRFCHAPATSLRKVFKGTMVKYIVTCTNNHEFIWMSQPLVNQIPLGNFFLAASTSYTGNTFTATAEIFNCCGIRMFSERTFYNLQRNYLLPTINCMWQAQQKKLLTGRAMFEMHHCKNTGG